MASTCKPTAFDVVVASCPSSAKAPTPLLSGYAKSQTVNPTARSRITAQKIRTPRGGRLPGMAGVRESLAGPCDERGDRKASEDQHEHGPEDHNSSRHPSPSHTAILGRLLVQVSPLLVQVSPLLVQARPVVQSLNWRKARFVTVVSPIASPSVRQCTAILKHESGGADHNGSTSA
jgi:hypothetical protein